MATEVDRLEGRLQGPVWREREGRGRRGVGLLWAGLLVLLLAAAAAIWVATRGGGEGEVPMILADDSPLRVRPAEPGGYRVPNQDIEAYPGARARQAERRVEVLLPPPEEPKPLPRPAAPAPPPAATTASPSAAQPQATPPAAPSSAPSAAAVAPAPVPLTAGAPPSPPPPRAAQPEAPRPAQTASPSGPVSVQLAAVTAEAQVQPEIARLRARLAQELGARPLTASRIDRDGRPLWRIRAGGFPDEASARAFCETVRAKGMGCLVVSGS